MCLCSFRNNSFLLSILLIFIHFNFTLSQEYSLLFRIYTPNALTIEISSGQNVEKITTQPDHLDVQTYSNWVFPKPGDIIIIKALNGTTNTGEFGELPTGIAGTIQIGGFVVELTESILTSSDGQHTDFDIANKYGKNITYFLVDATAYIYLEIPTLDELIRMSSEHVHMSYCSQHLYDSITSERSFTLPHPDDNLLQTEMENVIIFKGDFNGQIKLSNGIEIETDKPYSLDSSLSLIYTPNPNTDGIEDTIKYYYAIRDATITDSDECSLLFRVCGKYCNSCNEITLCKSCESGYHLVLDENNLNKCVTEEEKDEGNYKAIECYTRCETCFAQGNENAHYCNSCKEGYNLQSGISGMCLSEEETQIDISNYGKVIDVQIVYLMLYVLMIIL